MLSHLLEDLGSDGHAGVHRVGDDGHQGLGAVLGNGVGNVLDDAGVYVEQVIAGHAGLAWHTSGNDHHIGSCKRWVYIYD